MRKKLYALIFSVAIIIGLGVIINVQAQSDFFRVDGIYVNEGGGSGTLIQLNKYFQEIGQSTGTLKKIKDYSPKAGQSIEIIFQIFTWGKTEKPTPFFDYNSGGGKASLAPAKTTCGTQTSPVMFSNPAFCKITYNVLFSELGRKNGVFSMDGNDAVPVVFEVIPGNVSTPTPSVSRSVSPQSTLIKKSGGQKVYVVKNGKLMHIPSLQVFKSLNYQWKDVKTVDTTRFRDYKRAHLMRVKGGSRVYYITPNGYRKHIPTIRIFASYGNKWEDIVEVSERQINWYPETKLVRLWNGAKVYKVENNKKQWIRSAADFNRMGYDWKSIVTVNKTEMNGYPETGKEKWKFKTADPITSPPIAFNETIYFGSFDNYFYALDIATGKEKWKFKTGDKIFPSPAIANGVIYFGGNDNYLYALDAETGKEKWKFKTGDKIFSSPAIANGVIYFGSNDNYFYALDANTGKEKWKFKTKGVARSSPIVADDAVYFGSDSDYFYALDSETGKEKWKFKTEDKIPSSPAIANNMIYFGSFDNYFYALDIATGKEKWKFKTGDKIFPSPAIANGVIYFGSFDNYLYALDAETGKEKWKFKTGNQIFSSPSIVGGTVYFGNNNGYLYALDAATGREKTRFKAGKWIWSRPLIIDNVIYFGSEDGYLYAIENK